MIQGGIILDIYPAIDIRKGRCVRLEQGDFSKEIVFSDSPVEMAKHWEQKGSKWLHIVDLDGAKNGKPQSKKIISKIADQSKIKIQLGGGIRDFSIAQKYDEIGVYRFILGTAAIESSGLIEVLIKNFGADRVAIGVDIKDGFMATKGWRHKTKITLEEMLKSLGDKGVKNIIYTDISKDGMLKGPDFCGLEKILHYGCFSVIASGGISSIEDIQRLKKYKNYGLDGVIVGKALYAGQIQIEDLIDIAKEV